MPDQTLAGKAAIVTGGSRGKHRNNLTLHSKYTSNYPGAGIGAEIARELVRRGASVLITYSNSAKSADEVVKELQGINPNIKAKAIQADAAKAEVSADKIVTEAAQLFGGIDIIVNNAANGEDLNLSAVTQKTFDACFHPNVLFPLLLVKQSKPILRKKARIVNISSSGARVGNFDVFVSP